MKRLGGVIAAVPTMLDENEDINRDEFRSLLDFVVESGADGVFVLGSMGEGPALLDEQKATVVETAVSHLDGAVPVLACAMESSTRRAIVLGSRLAEAGPQYLVVTTGAYYAFPDSKSTRIHVESFAERMPVPVLFYNVPAVTGNAVDSSTLLDLMRFENVCGIKDSSGSWSTLVDLIRAFPDRDSRPFTIFQGDESVYDVSLLMGVDGLITGGGTLFIPTLKKLYQAATAGDRKGAFSLQSEFLQSMTNMLGNDPEVDWMAAVKYALQEKGIGKGKVTSPFLNNFDSSSANRRKPPSGQPSLGSVR